MIDIEMNSGIEMSSSLSDSVSIENEFFVDETVFSQNQNIYNGIYYRILEISPQ